LQDFWRIGRYHTSTSTINSIKIKNGMQTCKPDEPLLCRERL
jgi:hypothetical protein